MDSFVQKRFLHSRGEEGGKAGRTDTELCKLKEDGLTLHCAN